MITDTEYQRTANSDQFTPGMAVPVAPETHQDHSHGYSTGPGRRMVLLARRFVQGRSTGPEPLDNVVNRERLNEYPVPELVGTASAST